MDKTFFGERLQQRRKDLNLTLKQLSEKCGILPQLISDYENNRKEPGLKNLKNMCEALNVTPNYFLQENNSYEYCKAHTYGEALDHYLSALELLESDQLLIDRKTRAVSIVINDEIVKNALIQLEDFLNCGGDIAKTIRDFNINNLSLIEIKRTDN